MRTSDAGLALIQHFEGLRTTAYQDSVGVWTVGYGHTGVDVHAGMEISEDTAHSLLVADAVKAEHCISRCVHAPIQQHQFDALVSFAFNLGCGALEMSTLLKKLNRSDYAGAAAEFGNWVKAGGQVLPGLVKRRAAEAAMFRGGDWTEELAA